MTFSYEMSAACVTDPATRKKQRTLEKPISISGAGLFTGEPAEIRLCPAESGHGIVFKRTDLPQKPTIPAKLKYLKASQRCTMLVNRNASVQTVEHLLAALRAYEIDNVLIEISGPEVPILDGSALPFVEAMEHGEVCQQDAYKPIYQFSKPFYLAQKDVQLVALPSDEFRISYTLHYPHSSFIGSQFFTSTLTPQTFKNEIASSRTFSLHEELSLMLEKGIIKGGSLDNGVVIGKNGVLNPEGLRYPDEFVRHKVLDLIGDLSLMGIYFNAHIIAIRSGHATNQAFGLELLNHIKMENS